MIAEEGVEGSERGPACAEGFCGIATEAADVGADYGDLVNASEAKHTGNGPTTRDY